MSDAILTLSDLTSGYGSASVVRDVSLDIKQGEILAVLGKNGMGKSTLLKTIMGFVSPFGGQVILRDKNVTKAPPHTMARSGVAHIPQENTLFPDLSVEDNLRLGVNSDRLFRQRRPPRVRARAPEAERCRRPRADLRCRCS